MLGRGDKIGEYTLLDKLGTGGFSDVWKAEKRTALDVNYFALKFFRPKNEAVDFDNINKEIAVWKQLKGLPHIISIIELDRFEDYIYVVSDFADGGSLENRFANSRGRASSPAEAVKITLEILTGLDHLHKKGFVHRDIKPDNILIVNGYYCLADFGVTREIKTHSKATGTAGTMVFMPPEAFEKKPFVTPQTDIWSVGVILQRLLTGKLPYPQDDPPALMRAILMSEPDEMPETIPHELREIVKKSLQKEPENRFQSAQEMMEALKKMLPVLVTPASGEHEIITIIDQDFEKIAGSAVPGSALPEAREQTEVVQKTFQEPARMNSEIEDLSRLRVEESVVQPPKTENLKFKIDDSSLQTKKKPLTPVTWIIIGIIGLIALFGGVGIILSLIWTNQDVNGSASNTNSVNAADNRPVNTISNGENSGTAANQLTNTSNSAVGFYQLAESCREKKNYNCAVKNYSKAIDIAPDYADAYNNRGIVYHYKRNYDQAIRDFTRAIDLKPYFEANAYSNRGAAYKEKRNYDQAIADYDRAIELKPDYMEAYNNRGAAYFLQGNYDQAIADFQKALSIDPDYKTAKENLNKVLKKKNK